jgi:hypothetical protein
VWVPMWCSSGSGAAVEPNARTLRLNRRYPATHPSLSCVWQYLAGQVA